MKSMQLPPKDTLDMMSDFVDSWDANACPDDTVLAYFAESFRIILTESKKTALSDRFESIVFRALKFSNKKGRRPKTSERDTYRVYEMCKMVHLLNRKKKSLEEAFAEVADKFGVNEATVARHYKDFNRRLLKN